MNQAFIKYSALFIFSMIIIVGIFDCAKQLNQLMTVRQQEKSTQAELTVSKRRATSLHKQFTVHDKDELIKYFLYQAQKNGLMLKSLSSAKFAQDGMVTLDAMLQGGFPQVIDFFASIERACFPFLINHFALARNHQDLNLSLKITLLGICEKNQTKVLIKKISSDPFVSSIDDFSDPEKSRMKLLKEFSFKQMHLIGYLQSSHEMLAIMQLPDGESVEVHRGDVLGREHALVTKISDNHIRAAIGHEYMDLTSED